MVIVIPATDTIDAKNRSQGMIDAINAWGHATVVISPTEARSTAQGSSVMETLMLQNPDADAVLTYNADTAMGVNEFIMGRSQTEKLLFGVFNGDWSPPVKTINMSLNNEAVFRGTIRIVGPELDGAAADLPGRHLEDHERPGRRQNALWKMGQGRHRKDRPGTKG